jgi:hypothetical protein
VLSVRRFLVDGERTGGELGGVAAQRRRVAAAGRALELLESLREPPADDAAQQPVGHAARGKGGTPRQRRHLALAVMVV